MMDVPNSNGTAGLANTARRAGMLTFLGLVCASVAVALIMSVQMFLDLFL